MQKISLSTNSYYDLWKLLNETRDAILKTRETELAQFNISGVQARVLFFVQANTEPTTPAVLARWLFRESQSVSGLLTRMEKQGLIERVKDLERKNQVRIVVTEKGRQAYHQSTKRKSIQRIMSSLSEERRQQLKSHLQTLRDEALKELAMVRQRFTFPYFE